MSKSFGKFKAVENINLNILRGDIYGFLGLNGAGKTTTIRMLLGLLRPSSGSVTVFEKDFAEHSLEIKSRVGAVVEIPAFYPELSGMDNLSLLASLDSNSKNGGVEEALKEVGLSNRAKDKVGTYSQGMRQRLGIASAIMSQPELVILDEPTNGLDPRGILDVRALIKKLARERGMTFLFSSHILSEVELLCNRVGIIDRGKMIFEGTTSSLIERGEGRYKFVVDDAKKACSMFAPGWCECRILSENEFEVNLDKSAVPEVAKTLVTGEVKVYEIAHAKMTLEDLFFTLTEEQPAGVSNGA
ncbi:MAG: ABC transporter ATP-binding protein [Planctomycetes bacterium]|nr:ABC transporter ATP-binding protein [Planctomycetota bacterium]